MTSITASQNYPGLSESILGKLLNYMYALVASAWRVTPPPPSSCLIRFTSLLGTNLPTMPFLQCEWRCARQCRAAFVVDCMASSKFLIHFDSTHDRLWHFFFRPHINSVTLFMKCNNLYFRHFDFLWSSPLWSVYSREWDKQVKPAWHRTFFLFSQK